MIFIISVVPKPIFITPPIFAYPFIPILFKSIVLAEMVFENVAGASKRIGA
jgi:hypothetical protein